MCDADMKGREESSTRAERLRGASPQHLIDARSPCLSRAGAVGTAFDAGNLALLSVLPDERAQSGSDHPNLGLRREACQLAGISRKDRLVALRLAEAYYDGGHAQFEPSECLAWAERVRSVVQRA